MSYVLVIMLIVKELFVSPVVVLGFGLGLTSAMFGYADVASAINMYTSPLYTLMVSYTISRKAYARRIASRVSLYLRKLHPEYQ